MPPGRGSGGAGSRGEPMLGNFTFHNPTKLIFGADAMTALATSGGSGAGGADRSVAVACPGAHVEPARLVR